jgi:phage terminase large subunit GpA-like protein
VVTYKKGRATTAWVLKNQGFRRNEPLDIRNYATAAMEIAHLPLEPMEERPKARKQRRVRRAGLSEE